MALQDIPSQLGKRVDPSYSHLLTDRLKGLLNSKDSFPVSKATPFEQKHFDLIETEDYFVCEKTNGRRFLLFFFHSSKGPASFLQDKHQVWYFIPNLVFPVRTKEKECLKDTVLDGELVLDQNTWKYRVFDMMVINGSVITQRSFNSRLGMLQQDVIRPFQMKYQKEHSPPIVVELKKLELAYGLHLLFNHISATTTDTDDYSIIWTPVKHPYTLGSSNKLLVWKPPEFKTAFLRITAKWSKDHKVIYSLEIAQGVTYKFYDHFKPESSLALKWKDHLPDGRIAEFRYDPKWEVTVIEQGYAPIVRKGGWRFVCFRDDVTTANDEQTVMKVLNSVQQGVTKEQLLSHIDRIRAAWKAREKGVPMPLAPPPPPASPSSPPPTSTSTSTSSFTSSPPIDEKSDGHTSEITTPIPIPTPTTSADSSAAQTVTKVDSTTDNSMLDSPISLSPSNSRPSSLSEQGEVSIQHYNRMNTDEEERDVIITKQKSPKSIESMTIAKSEHYEPLKKRKVKEMDTIHSFSNCSINDPIPLCKTEIPTRHNNNNNNHHHHSNPTLFSSTTVIRKSEPVMKPVYSTKLDNNNNNNTKIYTPSPSPSPSPPSPSPSPLSSIYDYNNSNDVNNKSNGNNNNGFNRRIPVNTNSTPTSFASHRVDYTPSPSICSVPEILTEQYSSYSSRIEPKPKRSKSCSTSNIQNLVDPPSTTKTKSKVRPSRAYNLSTILQQQQQQQQQEEEEEVDRWRQSGTFSPVIKRENTFTSSPNSSSNAPLQFINFHAERHNPEEHVLIIRSESQSNKYTNPSVESTQKPNFYLYNHHQHQHHYQHHQQHHQQYHHLHYPPTPSLTPSPLPSQTQTQYHERHYSKPKESSSVKSKLDFILN